MRDLALAMPFNGGFWELYSCPKTHLYKIILFIPVILFRIIIIVVLFLFFHLFVFKVQIKN